MSKAAFKVESVGTAMPSVSDACSGLLAEIDDLRSELGDPVDRQAGDDGLAEIAEVGGEVVDRAGDALDLLAHRVDAGSELADLGAEFHVDRIVGHPI